MAKRRKTAIEAAAPQLLGAVAAALNACQEAGLAVRLRHGVVMTPAGYVLEAEGGRWVARTLAWTEFSTVAAEDEDG